MGGPPAVAPNPKADKRKNIDIQRRQKVGCYSR